MTVTRFTPNPRLREDINRRITPKVFVQDNIVAPSGEFFPADWLPVQFLSTDSVRGSDAFVISEGKLVSLQRTQYGVVSDPMRHVKHTSSVVDRQIFPTLVPSGFRTKLGGNSSTSVYGSTVLSYTTTDATYGVKNLVTGSTVTGAVSYTGEQVCDALIERGLVNPRMVTAGGGTIPVASDAHVNVVIDLFISEPVGVTVRDIAVFAGFAELGNATKTNYRIQGSVEFWTQGQLRLPWRTQAKTDDLFDVSALDAAATTAAAGKTVASGTLWKIANIRQIDRYSYLGAAAPVVALGLTKAPVAVVTDRTPFTCDVDDVLVTHKRSPADIASAGDFYVDYDLGVLFLHADTWDDTLVTANADPTFSYYYYGSGGTAAAHRYALFEGDALLGDFVTYDSESNFTRIADSSVSTNVRKAVGRIVDFEIHPKNLLDYTKSYGDLVGATALSKMPGTATKGFPEAFTLPALDSNIISDRFVIVTLNVR